MHAYRSHSCAGLRKNDVGSKVRLSGWVHRVRDHGGLLFIDLRDHYGISQIVADPDSPAFKIAETVRGEWVIRVDGEVKARSDDTINKNLDTGEIEVFAGEIEVLSAAAELPLPVFGEPDYPEDVRLKYRFLDLRRETLHKNMMLRSKVISSMRRRMTDIDSLITRRRTRFLGAKPYSSGQFLCTAASPSTIQTADYGIWL
jgi:aspartyl-tRNA synthetase